MELKMIDGEIQVQIATAYMKQGHDIYISVFKRGDGCRRVKFLENGLVEVEENKIKNNEQVEPTLFLPDEIMEKLYDELQKIDPKKTVNDMLSGLLKAKDEHLQDMRQIVNKRIDTIKDNNHVK
jgi:hypothetical protein